MSAQTAPYKNPKLSVEDRVKDLLKRMTTEEKIAQLRSDSDPSIYEPALKSTGFGFFTIYRLRSLEPQALADHLNDLQRMAQSSRLGIPLMPYEEALHGLIDHGHTSFPQAIGLAATWDPEFVHQVAEAIAKDTKAQGVSQVLSPVINVCRDARWGRMEESYGEDPFLTARMGVAFVTAFEQNGVVTTPKHYVANLGDGGRDSYSIHLSDRELFNVYMPPFQAVFQEGGARSVMCSYNALNGVPTASDPWLLTDVLRKQWGFKGYVVSDWGAAGAVRGTFHQAETLEETSALLLNAGMDSEAPSIYVFGKPLEDAVKSGRISMKTLNQSVARVLRVKFEKGLFDNPLVDPAAAAAIANSREHRNLAEEAARRATVLLKNDGGLLPLAKTGRIAVFGDLANDTVPLGGYSGNPGTQISILQGLKDRAPSVQFDFVPGCAINAEAALPAIPADALGGGLKAEIWWNQDMSGPPALTRVDPTIDFNWGEDPPIPGGQIDHFSVRWTGTLTAPETGDYAISITSDDGGRVFIDNKLIADNWGDHAPSSVVGHVSLQAGKSVPLKVEFYENGGGAVVKLGWQKTSSSDTFLTNVKGEASKADAVLVFAGIREGEGQDRAFLKLPGNQEKVIDAAAQSGKPVIVVLVAGAPVTMESWLDKVPAILDVWYPGQEGPHAVADILFGDSNPGGKLPMTFPQTVGQCPLYYNFEPSGRGYGYVDMSAEPLYPFGHGLSYTTFEYSNLKVAPESGKGPFEVSVDLTNTGKRAGDEVVQLYLHQQVSSMLRPFKELKGFQRIALQPGETKTVSFRVGFDELSMYDRRMKRVVEPGKFDVMVGSSSADIRQNAMLEVK